MEGDQKLVRLSELVERLMQNQEGKRAQIFSYRQFQRTLNAKQTEIQDYCKEEKQRLSDKNMNFTFTRDNITYVADFAKFIFNLCSITAKTKRSKLLNQLIELFNQQTNQLCQLPDYRKFIQQILMNLINQGCLEYKKDINYYLFIEYSMRNHSILTSHKIGPQKLLSENVNFPRQNLPNISQLRFGWKQSQLKQKLKSLVGVINQIKNQTSWLSEDSRKKWKVNSSSSQQQFQTHDFNEMEAIALNILTNHGKQVVKNLINQLLQHVQKSQLDKANEKIYRILLIQSIWEIFYKDNSLYQSNLQYDPSRYYSLRLARESRIPQFQRIQFEQEYLIMKNKECLQARNFKLKSIQQRFSLAINPSFFWIFGLQMMNFLKNTLINGLHIQIKEWQICVLNKRMVYCLDQPFVVTKHVDELKLINPMLSDALTKLINSVPKSNQKFNWQRLYKENQLKSNRIKQFKSFGSNLKEIASVIELLLQEVNYQHEKRQFTTFLNLLQENFSSFNVQKTKTLELQYLLGKIVKLTHNSSKFPQEREDEEKYRNLGSQYSKKHAPLGVNQQNKDDNIIEQIFCLFIDLLIVGWNKIFDQKPQQFKTLQYHWNSNYQLRANYLNEHLFFEVSAVSFQDVKEQSQQKQQQKKIQRQIYKLIIRQIQRFGQRQRQRQKRQKRQKRQRQRQRQRQKYKRQIQIYRQTTQRQKRQRQIQKKKEKEQQPETEEEEEKQNKKIIQYFQYQPIIKFPFKSQIYPDPIKTTEVKKSQIQMKNLIIQILREQYQIKLKKLAQSLLNINSQGVTGIQGVSQINENALGIQIHSEDINPQRTIIFGEYSESRSKQLFYRLFLPILQKKGQSQKDAQQKTSYQSRIQFSQDYLQNVIKTFINRTLMAFKNASKLNIKVSVFLLRHLMIDNHLNRQNYPNLVPRLDVLHSFVEANISNTNKRTDFVEIHYLNKSIAKLNLPAESHNKLISAVFFLSLITKKSQLQFLKQISQFIQQKIPSGVSNIDIDDYVIQMIDIIEAKQSSDHVSFYLDRIRQQPEVIPIFRTLVIKAMSKKKLYRQDKDHYNIVDYFFNDQKFQSLRLQEQFHQQTSMLSYEVGHIFFSYRLTGEITYFIKNTYNLNQERFIAKKQSLSQYEIRDKLLKLLYENTKRLNWLYKYYPSAFRSIQPIIYVKSFLNDPEKKHHHFVVVTQILNHFHCPKIHNYYQIYFGNNQIRTERINEKSIYFNLLKKSAQNSLKQELYDIPQQAFNIKFELLNINIISVSLSPFYFIEDGLDEAHAMYEEPPSKQLKPPSKQLKPPSKHLRPIFNDLTLCRYIGSLPLKKVNEDILTQIFREVRNPNRLCIEHDFNAISCPLYHVKFLQNSTFKFFHQNGNIGFIVCLLTLNNPFLERYRVSKEIIYQSNFSPLSIDQFVDRLIYFVQNQFPNIPEPLRNFLINSIHPLEQHRLQLHLIKKNNGRQLNLTGTHQI